MGNCQAAEAATVLIHHPAGNRVERIYSSVTANHVMRSNPGHYVALVLPSPVPAHSPPPSKQLKLLKPDDTLLIGHVYRLVSFEDVLKEFAAKKCVKLGKLLEKTEGLAMELRRKHLGPDKDKNPKSNTSIFDPLKVEAEKLEGSSSCNEGMGMGMGGNKRRCNVIGRHNIHGGGQWRPALQSISEAAGT